MTSPEIAAKNSRKHENRQTDRQSDRRTDGRTQRQKPTVTVCYVCIFRMSEHTYWDLWRCQYNCTAWVGFLSSYLRSSILWRVSTPAGYQHVRPVRYNVKIRAEPREREKNILLDYAIHAEAMFALKEVSITPWRQPLWRILDPPCFVLCFRLKEGEGNLFTLFAVAGGGGYLIFSQLLLHPIILSLVLCPFRGVPHFRPWGVTHDRVPPSRTRWGTSHSPPNRTELTRSKVFTSNSHLVSGTGNTASRLSRHQVAAPSRHVRILMT